MNEVRASVLKILITGPQGSGKTTQAKLLAEFLKVPFIGMGEILRTKAMADDELGRRIKESLGKGELVDDEIVANFTKEEVDSKNSFVMDGYPRSLYQMELFDPNFNKVFYLEIPEDQVLERLLRRGRLDDSEDLIRQRLNLYHQMTEPLLERYESQGILVNLDGAKSIDEIQKEIRERVNG